MLLEIEICLLLFHKLKTHGSKSFKYNGIILEKLIVRKISNPSVMGPSHHEDKASARPAFFNFWGNVSKRPRSLSHHYACACNVTQLLANAETRWGMHNTFFSVQRLSRNVVKCSQMVIQTL